MVAFAQSERSHRSYMLSREPEVFPFGVSFVNKDTHHGSLFLHTYLSVSQECRRKNIHIYNFFLGYML